MWCEERNALWLLQGHVLRKTFHLEGMEKTIVSLPHLCPVCLFMFITQKQFLENVVCPLLYIATMLWLAGSGVGGGVCEWRSPAVCSCAVSCFLFFSVRIGGNAVIPPLSFCHESHAYLNMFVEICYRFSSTLDSIQAGSLVVDWGNDTVWIVAAFVFHSVVIVCP